MSDSMSARLSRAASNNGMTSLPGHEPSLWLRNELLAIGRGLVDGTVPVCAHAVFGAEVTVALYDRRALCGSCSQAFRLTTGSAEDRTCDRCSVVVAEGGVIHPAILQGGPGLLVIFGLCPDCNAKEVGHV